MEDLLWEVSIASSLHHENIQLCYGAALYGDDFLTLHRHVPGGFNLGSYNQLLLIGSAFCTTCLRIVPLPLLPSLLTIAYGTLQHPPRMIRMTHGWSHNYTRGWLPWIPLKVAGHPFHIDFKPSMFDINLKSILCSLF